MPTNYVMVDFENTQPASLDELPVGAFKIKVFVGASQAKGRVSFQFSKSLQHHGANAQYVEMTRSGPNAMDMHIAYFVGQLLAVEPDASIYIVSKDKDFDPLIEFLERHGGRCKRVKSIAEIMKQQAPVRAMPAPRPAPPSAKPAAPRTKQSASVKPPPAAPKPARAKMPPPAPKAAPSDLDAVVKQLRSMQNKPGKRKALAQTIGAYFKHHGGARGEKEIELVIDELVRRGFVKQDANKIAFTLG